MSNQTCTLCGADTSADQEARYYLPDGRLVCSACFHCRINRLGKLADRMAGRVRSQTARGEGAS